MTEEEWLRTRVVALEHEVKWKQARIEQVLLELRAEQIRSAELCKSIADMMALQVPASVLLKHRHTDECVRYAVKTARAGHGYHCIAECAESRRAALGLKEDE